MNLRKLASLSAGLLALALPMKAEESVGQFASHADVGAPAIAGSTTYDASLQQYRMSAGGINMWGDTDQFQFAWKKIEGDFIARARIEFVGQGVDAHRKAGWIARTSLDADSAYADACIHGDGLTSLQYRSAKGAVTEQITLDIKGGDVVQLERRGNTYIFSSARYGETFTTATLENLDLGEELFVGLFLCSHNAEVKEEAIFRDVRIAIPPKVGYVPYRDYIGSHLEILNVFTGKLELVHSSPEQFEAPNWLPGGNGRTLIVNVSGPGPNKGHLKTFDLVTKTVAPLDTGNIVRNNNDHVLTFDGTRLGISSGEDDGRSVIYTLPASGVPSEASAKEGGTPKRITPKSPSYLHGWSPDTKWLVYTGGRKHTPDATSDKYDIYKIPSEGGEEIRLTDSPGLNDGPEYSPDGQWIYFNSTRSGLMQLWRMRPDGSGQEMVTDDEFNNWFPHISPDGKWIVFISYGQDVRPEDHPYYKHCYIRMMPATGGKPRVVAYVFGGQGTINVPSWSPDCARIAFVSNTDGL